jgi:hypothetical protein
MSPHQTERPYQLQPGRTVRGALIAVRDPGAQPAEVLEVAKLRYDGRHWQEAVVKHHGADARPCATHERAVGAAPVCQCPPVYD